MSKIFKLFLLALLCCFTITAFAAEKTEASKEELNLEQPIETITMAEMESRLQDGNKEDILYLKIADDQVQIYRDTNNDRGLRRQIVLTAPKEELLRLYTNNEKTYRQMSRMLLDYDEGNKNFNGYKVISDVDNAKKLKNGEKVYRFWFMMVERSETGRSRYRLPVDIGIGIGIGGGWHHHRRGGSWIGIGW